MNFKVGDTVVHWTHGLGMVIAIDEIHLAGITQQYYVVENELLKLWVPIAEAQQGSLRFPMESAQFKKLFDILRTSGESLPDNPYQRKLNLRARMQKRSLEGLCHVIRDLTARSRQHTLNQNDASVLFRAEEHLLDEWAISLGVKRSSALRELDVILRKDLAETISPTP